MRSGIFTRVSGRVIGLTSVDPGFFRIGIKLDARNESTTTLGTLALQKSVKKDVMADLSLSVMLVVKMSLKWSDRRPDRPGALSLGPF